MDPGNQRNIRAGRGVIQIMKIEFVAPRIELKTYIDCIWIFESEAGLPNTDRRVIVPRGGTRIIPKNALGKD